MEIRSNDAIIDQALNDTLFLESNLGEVTLKNGTSIKVFDNGNFEKPVILFVPMIKEVNFLYVPLIKYFKNNYRPIIYEPNLSTTKHFRVADRVAEINNLLETLNIPQCNIIAWSDTCSTAYYLGKKYPNLCASISFLGIADRYILPQPYQFLVKALSDYQLEKIIPSIISAYFMCKCLGGNHIRFKWLFAKAKRIPDFTKILKFSIVPNLTDHIPIKSEMKVACKIICGERDFLANPERSAKMFQLLPNCYGIDTIYHAEHFFVYINHKDVALSIDNFFNQIKK